MFGVMGKFDKERVRLREKEAEKIKTYLGKKLGEKAHHFGGED